MQNKDFIYVLIDSGSDNTCKVKAFRNRNEASRLIKIRRKENNDCEILEDSPNHLIYMDDKDGFVGEMMIKKVEIE